MRGWLSIAVLASVASASADPVAESAGPPTTYATVSATVWRARGDWAEYAHTSPGMRGVFGYRGRFPWLSVVGTLDIVFVEPKGDDVTFYSFGVGPRVHLSSSSPLEPYAELVASWHRFGQHGHTRIELGYRIAGGLVYEVVTNLDASIAIGLDRVRYQYNDGADELSMLVGELGLGTRW